jgi:hypothetical protein
MGGLIHILLVVAIIVVLASFIQRRRGWLTPLCKLHGGHEALLAVCKSSPASEQLQKF